MRELNKSGIRRGPEGVKSKINSLVDSKCVIATKYLGEWSDCIIIYPMPPADQSVLRKVGFEVLYRSRKGDVMKLCLKLSNNSMSRGEYVSFGKF